MSDHQKYLDIISANRDPEIAEKQKRRDVLNKVYAPVAKYLDALRVAGEVTKVDTSFNNQNNLVVMIHFAGGKFPIDASFQVSESPYDPKKQDWKAKAFSAEFRGTIDSQGEPSGDYEQLYEHIAHVIADLQARNY